MICYLIKEKMKRDDFYFICPICKTKLKFFKNSYLCLNKDCKTQFPIVDNVPIFINESNSVFRIKDFLFKKETFFKKENLSFFKKFVPSISKNIYAKKNFNFIGDLLKNKKSAKVLVIGGSVLGEGFLELKKFKNLDFYETDVVFDSSLKAVLDAHNIPFEKNFFDLVIVQAVLEHVLNPFECVEEIFRVLKYGGVVYSEIPFMQQVHGGKYDFTRFTYLGHIRLFRKFDLIKVGACCGPGMAFSWAYLHFLLSFSSNKFYRNFVFGFASFTSFFFKYFDYFLIKKKSARFSMSGSFFIGRKSNKVLSDRKLLELFDK